MQLNAYTLGHAHNTSTSFISTCEFCCLQLRTYILLQYCKFFVT